MVGKGIRNKFGLNFMQMQSSGLGSKRSICPPYITKSNRKDQNFLIKHDSIKRFKPVVKF